jgi:hypothetical protein
MQAKEVIMPYLVTTSTYPSDIATKAAERYFEALQKYPVDENLVKELVPAAVKSTNQGLRVTGIWEVKEGKLEGALKRLTNFMVMFQTIPGFEYSIEINWKVEEALGLLGMELPK